MGTGETFTASLCLCGEVSDEPKTQKLKVPIKPTVQIIHAVVQIVSVPKPG